MFSPYFIIYLILSYPYTDALLHDAAILIDVDAPTTAPDLPLPENPGNPGCLWTCTEPNWHGNCTYTCFGPYNPTGPTCIRNYAYQASFGPDAGKKCKIYQGDKCEAEGLLRIEDPVDEMLWPGNPCMREYGSYTCWRVEGAKGTVGGGVAAIPTVQCPERAESSREAGMRSSGTLPSDGGAKTSGKPGRSTAVSSSVGGVMSGTVSGGTQKSGASSGVRVSGGASTGGVTMSSGSTDPMSKASSKGSLNLSRTNTPLSGTDAPISVSSGAAVTPPTRPPDLPPGYFTELPKPGTLIPPQSFTPVPPQSGVTKSLGHTISQSGATSGQATNIASTWASGTASDKTASPTNSNGVSQSRTTSARVTNSALTRSIPGISMTASGSDTGSDASQTAGSGTLSTSGGIPSGILSDQPLLSSGASGIPSGILTSDTHGLPSMSFPSGSLGLIPSLTWSYDSHGIPTLSFSSASRSSKLSASGTIPHGTLSSASDATITVTASGSTAIVTVTGSGLTGTMTNGLLPSIDCTKHPESPACPPTFSSIECAKNPGGPLCPTASSKPLPSIDCAQDPDSPACPSTSSKPLPSIDCARHPESPACPSTSAKPLPSIDCAQHPESPACPSTKPLPSIDCAQHPENPACPGGLPTPTTTAAGRPPWWNCDDHPNIIFCPHPTETAEANKDDDMDLYGLFALLAVPVIAVGLKSWLKRAKIAKKLSGLVKFKWPKPKIPRWGIHVPSIKLKKGTIPGIRIPPVGKAIRLPKIRLPKGRLHCGRNSASSSMVCVTSEAIERLAPLGEAGAPSRQARLCRVSPPVPPRDKYSLEFECGPPAPPNPPTRAKTPKQPSNPPVPPVQQQQPPDTPDKDPNYMTPSLTPDPLIIEKKPPPDDTHNLIDEELYTDFFNEVYFADVVDGLSCGGNPNPPAEYRKYVTGGGCYYVPNPSKSVQKRKRAADSPHQSQTDGGASKLTETPSPTTNATKSGYCANSTTCIDPWQIPQQDDTFLTDDLVPPPGLAPTYYAEVDGSTAWLWTFFTTVSSELTTSMTNGIFMEDESDENMAVLVWATPNSSEASTTSTMILLTSSSTGKLVTKVNTLARRTGELSTLATPIIILTLNGPRETPSANVNTCLGAFCV